MEYYNTKEHRLAWKSRPILIIGEPRNNDYTVLPVSTISRKENLDAEFDVEIDPAVYSALGLNKVSYVRTHKQLTVHYAKLGHFIGDLRSHYPELFEEIMQKLAVWNQLIQEQARKS
ncbi:MAG: type II toxin-antitoxin system PemK/MazF family toxin [Dialister sp.]|nr:type II toxin-antitoxin system PemK/MazF family toxin [Dialister sp.]